MCGELFACAVMVFTGVVIGCTASMPSALQRSSSGIKGTTRSMIISGVPGGPTAGGPTAVEFAIAPVAAGKPVYDRSIFVKSEADGAFEVELSPGTYWIGPKGKALDPLMYEPGAVVFSEMTVVVKERAFVSVELVETGYAP